MDIRILGPLEVLEGGRPLDLGGAKQRAALAVLAVNANRVVSHDELIEALWEGTPPDSARKAIQIYVSQLRKLLGRDRVETRGDGYLLRVEERELDVARVERLRDDPEAALELWRGAALADFSEQRFAQAEIARLEELRVSLLERRIDRDLDTGRHADVIGELDALTREHPQREHVRAQLMLALYRAGRQAEALEAYQIARAALVEELGIEPGRELRELHQRILRQDPLLDAPADTTRPRATRPAPGAADRAAELVEPAAVRPPLLQAGNVRQTATMGTSRCDACGEALPPAARYCPACGRPVAPEGGEMLKLVTVLFADVVSSTESAESRYPEETRAVLSDFFATMAAEIHAEGGSIEKYIGDAIMAVFGVPVAHEDDAARAVRAGRRMQARLREWNDARGADMRIRIGIDTGEVLASGAAGRDLMVTGDAVNAASRLEHEAPAGAVLIGERTAQAVRREFELTPLEPLRLRGISRPVHAWIVKGERRTAEPEGVAGLTTPMVGRDVELGLLQTLFGRTRNEAMPQLVTIVGDAGMGKTRLAREFCTSLAETADVLIGRCLPYGEGVTLWPLGEILKSLGGILETDPPDVAFAKIETLVRRTIHPDLARDPARTAAALASTIGLQPTDPSLVAEDPRDAQRELRAAWRALAASGAARRPLVVVVEDIHWADPTMLATIEDLASHVEGPLLLLTTARPETLHARPDWGGGLANYSALRLEPLPEEEGTRLLRHLFEVDELPVAVAVLDKAEGNPFFLEEILRGLVDTNRLRIEGGRLHATEGFGDLDIPDTVQAVILARIDLLEPDAKRALQLAAVIGRTFWRGALARLAGRDDLDDVLHVLVRRGLIRERLTSSVGGEIEYAFRHILIQEVAYDSVPRSERARAHAAAAHWIEATSGTRRDELAELLAHHYVTAHRISGEDELRWAARSYCLIAAGAAFRRFAIEPAETFASLAVGLSLPGSERVLALESLGDLYAVTLRGDAAWKAYTDALHEAEDALPDDRETLASLAARAATLYTRRQPTMNDPPTLEAVGRVVELGLAASEGSTSPERAELLAAWSYLRVLQANGADDPRGDEAAQTALALAEETGDANLLSAVIDGVALRQQALGLYGDVNALSLRRLEQISSLTDASEVCDAHVTAAWSSVIVGRYRDAVEHATRCIEVARSVDEGQYVNGLVWRVAAAFRAGEWDRALADQAEIERHVHEENGGVPPPFAMHAYASAYFCRLLRDEEEDAAPYVELLREFHERDDARRAVNGSRAVTVRALVHDGRLAEAETLLARVRGRHRFFYAEALADVLAARGDWDEAIRAARSLRDGAAAGGELLLPFVADRLEGRAAAARGDVSAARKLLRRAADGFAQLGAPWEEAQSRASLGALAGEDAELEQALVQFERLGAVRDAAACRTQLAHASS